MQDERIRYYVYPKAVVWCNQPENILNLEALLDESVALANIKLAPEGVSIVFDFGCEYHGGVRIRTGIISGSDGTHITQTTARLRFGESLAEVMGQPNNDHAIHDAEVRLPSHTHFEFGQTGFRFFRLDLTGCDGEIELLGVSLVALEQPWTPIGCFKCDDEEINRIWDVSVRTVHLCCQEHIWDGIKRDRLAWAGDVQPQLPVLGNIFGQQADPIVRKTLKYMADRTPHGEWVNGISSYSLWWIISLYDWFIQTGDIGLLREMESRLACILEMLEEHITEDGLEKLGGFRFLDWASAETPEKISPGLQAMCVWAFRCAKEMYEVLNDYTTADKYEEIHDLMKNHQWDSAGLPQNKCLAVYADICDVDEVASELINFNNPKMSPWFGGYYLEVLSRGGEFEKVLKLMKQYWGGMLKLGATTFWEHFDISWLENAAPIDHFAKDGEIDVHSTYGEFCYQGLRHSLCHGWAGSPVGWITQNILGVKPLEPGYKRINVLPQLGHLQFARGKIATSFGSIEVSHKRTSSGEIETEIQTPDEIEVVDSYELV